MSKKADQIGSPLFGPHGVRCPDEYGPIRNAIEAAVQKAAPKAEPCNDANTCTKCGHWNGGPVLCEHYAEEAERRERERQAQPDAASGPKKAERFQSNALWPAEIRGVSKYGDNISADTHDTEEQANAVCDALEREGFGGERKVFPLKTWVSPVQDPPVLPTADQSGDATEMVQKAEQHTPPFSNCKFELCDLPGQCRSEGKCHHPAPKADQSGDATEMVPNAEKQEPVAEVIGAETPNTVRWMPGIDRAMRERLIGAKLYAAQPDLAAENARLRAELESAYETAEMTARRQLARIEELMAQLAAAQKDAERHRFMRHADLDAMCAKYWSDGEVPTGDEYDAAIDAAIAEEKAE